MLFDAHLRIFAPASPRSANQGLVPPSTAEAYRRSTAALRVPGGAVVADDGRAVPFGGGGCG
jgi:hypothetical protein